MRLLSFQKEVGVYIFSLVEKIICACVSCLEGTTEGSRLRTAFLRIARDRAEWQVCKGTTCALDSSKGKRSRPK